MKAPAISKPVLLFFRGIARGYFRRHFHAVRLNHPELFSVHAADVSGPLIVYANHSSWWDPMVAILLAEKYMPARKHFAPMDAAQLDRYRILKHVGIFPVEMNSARGAAQFLRIGEAIVKEGGVLWITPQGQFVDTRKKPLQFKPGLAALAARLAPCVVLPLAIEYPFWDERLPECLLRFGQAVHIGRQEDPNEIQSRLIAALECTIDELKEGSLRREGKGFTTVMQGTLGAGGLYAFGQRLKALALMRSYKAEHTASARLAVDDQKNGEKNA